MKLNHVLLDLSSSKSNSEDSHNDIWTLDDAFKGVQIFGGIGSGKTSGSGYTIAKKFLENGFGGLVLCAKISEREDWEKLISETGRTNDLKVFCHPKPNDKGKITDKEFFFNPLNYENSRKDGGETFNLVNLFMQIYQMGRTISGEGLANNGERFWDNALKRCLSRLIDFLKLANEPITIDNMYRLISESPSRAELEYFDELRKNVKNENSFNKIKELAKENYYVRCYLKSSQELKKIYQDEANNKDISQDKKRQLQTAKKYFEKEFINLAEKTKTIIVESFLGLAEPFQSGILRRYFSSNNENTILPEETFNNRKIILLDFPIKTYLEAGIYAQGIFKLLWQQSVERRKYAEGDIPVFLWVDESHNFLTNYDQIFQTTARSAGASTVFLTQNVSNYYAAIGGKNPKPTVDSLLGNLSTKIFHANNDAVTNEWASKVIGWDFISLKTGGRSFDPNSLKENENEGYAIQHLPQIKAKQFTTLKTGGEINDYEVRAIITVLGKEWSDGKNHRYLSFTQHLKPSKS